MPVNLGIIGAGIMGERMLRAATEHAADVVRISGVWDPSADALDRVAPLGAPRAHSVVAAIEGADCVYVASPPGSHLEYARAALAAGKAVFLEKPLATDVADARAFVEENQNARVAVNFPFASSFAVARLHEWMQEGTLGAPRGVHIHVAFARWPRPWQQAAAAWLDQPAEGGFTREVVSHFLFLCRRLLGPLRIDSSVVDRVPGGTEHRVQARFHAGGLPGTLLGEVGAADAIADDHNTWTLAGVAPIRLRDWSFAERGRPDGSWVPDPDAQPNERVRPLVLRRQLEGVAALVAGHTQHLATLSEALEVQQAVETILHGQPGPDLVRPA